MISSATVQTGSDVVLDSSAVVAIHLQEAGYLQLEEKIRTAPIVAIGTPALMETTIVLVNRLRSDPRINPHFSHTPH